MYIKTRFAPSPTGFLHIGNIRIALINFLFAKKNKGQFILRIDDSDYARNQEEYKTAIIKDLKWLGLDWDLCINQTNRIEKYNYIKDLLIEKGRLYPCYESTKELEIKRNLQLASGLPPIYDRSSLKMTFKQINEYKQQGRKAYYRFLIKNEDIEWKDLIKKEIKYQGKYLSDPIVIREDGTFTYMLCSTIDDIDNNISHIIRGEDHITNTAIQTQIFQALKHKNPIFAHISLIKTRDNKISKREKGVFTVKSLREKLNIEPMAINSFCTLIGSSKNLVPVKNITKLIDIFDIYKYSVSPIIYDNKALLTLNQKILALYDFNDIKPRLDEIGYNQINEKFWSTVKYNLANIKEIKKWWDICYNFQPKENKTINLKLKDIAAKTLPNIINKDTYQEWILSIHKKTKLKYKDLFLNLRIILTGLEYGPEIKEVLSLLSREQILSRLKNSSP